jgi:hypothetical protein
MSDVPDNLVAKINRDAQEFEAKLLELAANASEKQRKLAVEIAAPGAKPASKVYTITPTLAAVLFVEHNKWNRDVSLAKMRRWRGAMERDEWVLNHQGLAFYEDGNIADGQHRLAAVAMSGQPQDFWVFVGLKRDALETIDQAFRRTAGDAMQMRGVSNGRLAAAVAEALMKYEHRRLYQQTLAPSITMVEKWAKENEKQLESGIAIAQSLKASVASLVLSDAENATIATGMLIGGYQDVFVRTFLVGVHSGVISQDYPNAPTSSLNLAFDKAQKSDRRKDSLTKEEKLARAFKGARLFYHHRGVASGVKWEAGKETLPAPTPYDEADLAAE